MRFDCLKGIFWRFCSSFLMFFPIEYRCYARRIRNGIFPRKFVHLPLSPRRSLSTERVFRERVVVGSDGATIVGKVEKEAIAKIDDEASFQFYGVWQKTRDGWFFKKMCRSTTQKTWYGTGTLYFELYTLYVRPQVPLPLVCEIIRSCVLWGTYELRTNMRGYGTTGANTR